MQKAIPSVAYLAHPPVQTAACEAHPDARKSARESARESKCAPRLQTTTPGSAPRARWKISAHAAAAPACPIHGHPALIKPDNQAFKVKKPPGFATRRLESSLQTWRVNPPCLCAH